MVKRLILQFLVICNLFYDDTSKNALLPIQYKKSLRFLNTSLYVHDVPDYSYVSTIENVLVSSNLMEPLLENH